MSSRPVLVMSGMLALLGAFGVESGCSDDASANLAEQPDAAARDAAQRDAPPTTEPPDPSLSRADCIEACSTAHPGGKARDDAIGSCWSSQCGGSCTPGAARDGGPTADAGVDGGTCLNSVTTGDPGCDLCTQARCCAEWDACFNDDRCARFTACAQLCPAQ